MLRWSKVQSSYDQFCNQNSQETLNSSNEDWAQSNQKYEDWAQSNQNNENWAQSNQKNEVPYEPTDVRILECKKLEQVHDMIKSPEFKELVEDESVKSELRQIMKIRTKTYFLGPDLENSKKVLRIIHGCLSKARSEVNVWCYSIGKIINTEIVKKLHKKMRNIKIISDQSQMTNKSLVNNTNKLYVTGVPIKFNTKAKSLMHCKFITIDDQYL